MPMYAWEHKETKTVVEVIRSFDDSGVPPTPEEAKGLTGEWEKIIGGNQTLLKTGRWGPGKGFWVVILGACACTQMLNWLV